MTCYLPAKTKIEFSIFLSTSVALISIF